MKNRFMLMVAVGSLLLLPACAPLDWIKNTFGIGKKSETITIEPGAEDVLSGETIVTMGDTAIITTASLDRDFDQLLDENPQLKSVLPLMPDAKYNFLQGMVSQAVVDRFVADNKIDQKKEYQEDLKRMVRSVRRMLNTKYFSLEQPVAVTDEEVLAFYETNKNSMPDLLMSRGGTKASGIQFNKEEEARAFAAKAKGRDFAKVAKEANMTDKVRDFKFVNVQSVGLDTSVKNKIVAMKKFPTTEVVKGDDKTFWVVNATELQEAQYRPFEQVQAGLKQYIEKEKRMTIFDKEVTRLKEEYKVSVNDTSFKTPSNETMAEQVMDEMPVAAEPARAA